MRLFILSLLLLIALPLHADEEASTRPEPEQQSAVKTTQLDATSQLDAEIIDELELLELMELLENLNALISLEKTP